MSSLLQKFNNQNLWFGCLVSEHESRESHECIISFLRKCLSMNGFFKAVWYISLNPFVSKLPSGSYKYSSLTSSALMLKLGKLCADAPMRNKRKGYQPKSCLSLLLLSSTNVEQRPLVPLCVGFLFDILCAYGALVHQHIIF